MTIWADNKGRFLFAPRALSNSAPYIDRMEVHVEFPVPFLDSSQFQEFLDTLDADIFQARHGNKSLIRAGWLFAGAVSLMRASGERGAQSLHLDLNLNPTRFLQAHNVPNRLTERNEILRDSRNSLDVSQRLFRARQSSFDGNDNYITHHDVVHGPIVDWGERAAEYFSAVYTLLREEIVRAFRQVSPSGFSDSAIPQVNDVPNRLRSIELYWEFRVDNAVDKVRRISDSFLGVLRNAYRTEYSSAIAREFGAGREHNSPYIKGLLGHNDISAKSYAKASQVVRFEVTFKRQPLRTLTGTRGMSLGNAGLGLAGLARQIDLVAEEASHRNGQFWTDFWAAQAVVPAPERSAAIWLLGRIARAADDTPVSVPELLSLLIDESDIEPFIGPNDGTDPVRRLREQGLLVRCDSSSTRSPRYRLRSRCFP